MKNEASRILLKCHFTFLAVGIVCHHKGTWIENLWRTVCLTCEVNGGKNAFSRQLTDGKTALSVSLAGV